MIPDQEGLPIPNPEEMSNIFKNYLDLIKDHSNELGWLLEQYAKLRSEHITFFKKDLKEIEGALQGLISNENIGKEFLSSVVNDFRKDLERSYELLNFTFFWKLIKMVDESGNDYE